MKTPEHPPTQGTHRWGDTCTRGSPEPPPRVCVSRGHRSIPSRVSSGNPCPAPFPHAHALLGTPQQENTCRGGNAAAGIQDEQSCTNPAPGGWHCRAVGTAQTLGCAAPLGVLSCSMNEQGGVDARAPCAPQPVAPGAAPSRIWCDVLPSQGLAV